MKTNMNADAMGLLKSMSEKSNVLLQIEANASLQTVYENLSCPKLIREALGSTQNWQWRNEVDVARTILSPGLALQWISALLAWGVEIVFSGGDRIMLAEYLPRTRQYPGKIAELRLLQNVPGRTWGRAYVGRTPLDAPIVSAVAVVDVSDGLVQNARLALTGVWRVHARLSKSADRLIGLPLQEKQIQWLITAIKGEVKPRGDYLGSVEYRREMAGVLARRALEMCMQGNR